MIQIFDNKSELNSDNLKTPQIHFTLNGLQRLRKAERIEKDNRIFLDRLENTNGFLEAHRKNAPHPPNPSQARNRRTRPSPRKKVKISPKKHQEGGESNQNQPTEEKPLVVTKFPPLLSKEIEEIKICGQMQTVGCVKADSGGVSLRVSVIKKKGDEPYKEDWEKEETNESNKEEEEEPTPTTPTTLDDEFGGEEHENAAKKIQSVWKQKNCSKGEKQDEYEEDWEEEEGKTSNQTPTNNISNDDEEKAATKIQSIMRGNASRRNQSIQEDETFILSFMDSSKQNGWFKIEGADVKSLCENVILVPFSSVSWDILSSYLTIKEGF